MRKTVIIVFIVAFMLILFSIYSFQFSFLYSTSPEELLPVSQVHLHKFSSLEVTTSEELLPVTQAHLRKSPSLKVTTSEELLPVTQAHLREFPSLKVTTSKELVLSTQAHLREFPSLKVTTSKELVLSTQAQLHDKKSKPILVSQLDNILRENCTKQYSPDFGKQKVYNLNIAVDAFRAVKIREFIEKTANPTVKKKLSTRLKPFQVSYLNYPGKNK